MTKAVIRSQIKQKRKEVTAYEIDRASRQITSQITSCKRFEDAETIFLYAAFNVEIQTRFLDEFARSKGKKTAYPKIQSDIGEISFYCINSLKELQAQSYRTMKIYEPDPQLHKKVLPAKNDIIIVPGLAFDLQGNRIGYGGGFYDKYLKSYPEVYKLGICMDFQLFNQIPAEVFDVKIDGIVTETSYYLPF
ncbi:5-formyltetrahydrofolate cyclo-ligase [Cellulosilyticum sp. I15G10I2]|uniref:5-formyltetrahydrofolate cyclo-ligase n=1 Tax=Cellulosilyticum sp. I15G10I2 TaxID=1892843 RepID=UPI00085C9732|nr:5-formyltetrahydrofolate cyclo-ligase [Cellulosilyticum sp. I15G10I2]